MRILGLDIRRQRDLSALQEEQPLRPRVARLEMQVHELTDALEQVRGLQNKLRAQFNGSKGGRPAAGEGAPATLDAIPVGDKVALRLAAGIRPGQRRA